MSFKSLFLNALGSTARLSDEPFKSNWFSWHGIDKLGNHHQGQLVAKNKTEAKQQLHQQDFIIRSLVRKRYSLYKRRTISPHDISLFTQQLATTIGAGLPLLQALTLIIRGQQFKTLRQLTITLQQQLNTGLLFAEALRQHPKIFNPFFCNLIAIGEESGTLDQMLKNLAHYLEKKEQIKKRIQKVMIYPISMLVMTLLVIIAFLSFVVPQFALLYKNFGAPLPPVTQMIILLSTGLQRYWLFILVGSYIVIRLFRYLYQHHEPLKKIIHQTQFYLPIANHLIKNTILINLINILMITYSAGLPLVNALKSANLATNNLLWIKGITEIHQAVLQGEILHQAMQETGLFPEFVIQMIQLGEETGTLSDKLRQIVIYYENRVDHTIHQLSSLLEPLLMALLGFLIGGLILAMYVPIVTLGTVI